MARNAKHGAQGADSRESIPSRSEGVPSRGAGPEHVNRVVLTGRLAASAEDRELPSGDRVVVLRVVVDRPERAVRGSARVDTIDCAAWTSRLRRTVTRWGPGDVVEVSGALRRRFYRAGAAVVSRVEVEVDGARRVSRAAPSRRETPRRAGSG